jgi:hypothetical protein
MNKKLIWSAIAVTCLAVSFIIIIPPIDKLAAKKTLEDNNYKVLEVGGYSWTGNRLRQEYFRTKFKAIKPNGNIVTGCVSKPLGYGSNVILENAK